MYSLISVTTQEMRQNRTWGPRLVVPFSPEESAASQSASPTASITPAVVPADLSASPVFLISVAPAAGLSCILIVKDPSPLRGEERQQVKGADKPLPHEIGGK